MVQSAVPLSQKPQRFDRGTLDNPPSLQAQERTALPPSGVRRVCSRKPSFKEAAKMRCAS